MATAASVEGRAAAVLTNSEVFGADCDVSDSLDGKVALDLSFTLGSLTSGVVRLYAGPAATPTDPLYINGVKQEYTLTGDTEMCAVVDCAGAAVFRASIEGVGTVGGSSAAFDYLYNDYEGSSRKDGNIVVGD